MAGATSCHSRWAAETVDECRGAMAETVLQLSLSAVGKQALLAHSGCMRVIRHHAGVEQSALSTQCGGALRCLEGAALPRGQTQAAHASEADKHLMISYQWDVQQTVLRIVASLKQRGFAVWFDLEEMSGSTLDAMAGAVEGASCVLICMSSKYKASANCRLEGNCESMAFACTSRADGMLGCCSQSTLRLYYS